MLQCALMDEQTKEWRNLGPANLSPGEHRGLKVDREEFVLLTNVDGVYYAIDDWCNHAGCLLSRSEVEGEAILCHCHYAEFNVKSGELISLPRICDDQTRYELRIENGTVFGKRLPDPESKF